MSKSTAFRELDGHHECKGMAMAVDLDGIEYMLGITECAYAVRFRAKQPRNAPKFIVCNYCPFCGANLRPGDDTAEAKPNGR